VHNAAELNAAIEAAQATDRIVLAKGVLTNVERKFSTTGTEDKPIYIVAEEKREVFLESESNIKICGTYLHLEGVGSRNGFTPTSSVISLQKDKNTPCNYCLVTECVINNYKLHTEQLFANSNAYLADNVTIEK